MQEQLTNLSPREQERLDKLQGILELSPVVLPNDRNVRGKNWFFGWPVAAMSKKSLVVVYYAIPSHSRHYPKDFHSSNAMTVYSTNGGASWSKPLDLNSIVKESLKNGRYGFGNSITTLSDGSILLLTNSGAFRSSPNGKSWKHIPKAFSAEQVSPPSTHHGPRIASHSRFGLITTAHSSSHPVIDDTLWLYNSLDDGATWVKKKFDLLPSIKPVEPTPIVYNDQLIILARSHGSYDQATLTWRYVQIVFDKNLETFVAKPTTITASESVTPDPAHGPWCQDTVDLALNPVTNRLEAVVTNRMGGGEGKEHIQDQQTLNLWSIDPAELLSGSATWKFECTLLNRIGNPTNPRYPSDGMHPGGAIIDEKHGMQHIFIYLGYGTGPSGIFRITRTLDTGKLVERSIELEE